VSDEIVDWFDGRYYHFTWEYRVSQTRVPIVNTRKRLNESHFITLQTSHSPLDPRRRRDALTVRHPPPRFPKTYIVRSMIAETISPSLPFSAFTALPRDTPACVMTSSMSFGSTPVSSTSPSSSSVMVALGASTEGIVGANALAAAACAAAERSSILASPKITCVSEFGCLYTSGLEIRKRTFLLFLIVTWETLGTGFNPSFKIALRLFFSLRDCLPPGLI
jgi:hypothetical protein